MLKRIIFFILAFVFFNSFAIAATTMVTPMNKFGKSFELPTPAEKSPLDGLYAGIGVGVATGNGANTSWSLVDLPTGAEQVQIINNNLNENVVPVFTVHLGYGFVYASRVYTGIEFFADQRNQDSSADVSSVQQDALLDFAISNEVEMKTEGVEYGVRIKPGYLFTEKTLLYLVVGYVRSRYEISNVTSYFNRAAADTGVATLSANRSVNGIEFGIGMEYAVGHGLSVRAQYLYTGYESMNLSGAAPIFGVPASNAGDHIEANTSLTPKHQSITFSLQYYFT